MRDACSHKGILESLSAFLMPCTTIETCSMAGFSCGWLLQATFWGLSSQEGCSIEALPNYLPGVHQRKSPLGHSVLQKMLYLEGETTVPEPSSSDTLSGNTGKTNLLKIHHYENLPKCEALGSPNTNKQVKNSTWERSPCKDGWNDRPSHCKEIYKNEGLAVEWKHLM